MTARQVSPNFKVPAPVKKAGKGIRAQRAGTPAALKRRALRLWGEFIHERDKVCQACGRPDGKLEAHHIMVRGFNATASYEPNGILLCASHHKLGRQSVHQDPHWAVCLYTERLGVDGYEALRRKAYDGVNGKYPAAFWRAEIERLEWLLAGGTE